MSSLKDCIDEEVAYTIKSEDLVIRRTSRFKSIKMILISKEITSFIHVAMYKTRCVNPGKNNK